MKTRLTQKEREQQLMRSAAKRDLAHVLLYEEDNSHNTNRKLWSCLNGRGTIDASH